MALITCPECGQSVSDHADACPKCGYPVGAMIEKQKKDVDDLCNLGCKYLNGDGVSRDYKKAAEYFRNAAEQGHAIAQYNLGLMYELGDGVPQSYSNAFSWYLKAAEQGLARAQYDLASLYERGKTGLQSYMRRQMWA